MTAVRPDRERVVVTGVGVKSPAGITAKEAMAALLMAESTAATIPELTLGGAVVDFGCAVPDFTREDYLSAREMRQLDRLSTLAIAAATDAVADAGPHWPAPPEHSGVFVGTGIGGLGTMELAALANQHRPSRIPAFTVLRVMNSSPAARISARLGVRGPTLTFSTACASGATAIGEAVGRIRAGELTAVLAGGTEAPLTPLVVSAFATMRALSPRTDAPHLACRPFDDDRDGFVIAEGAAFVVLERLDHAKGRGARVYGEVAGYAANTDINDMVSPSPDGAAAAEVIRLALADARLAPGDIGHISAHGTSTVLNDHAEARALESVFGAGCPPVTAPKGVSGHMVGAAGAFEAAMALLLAAEGLVPPVANFGAGRDADHIDLVSGTPRHVSVAPALSTSFGFGGQNACLVVIPGF